MGETTEEKIARLKEQKEAQRKAEEKKKKDAPAPVSMGPVDRITDVLINPTGEKILELTNLDRNQVTLIPQLGIIDDMWQYLYELAEYRQDPVAYKEKYERTNPELANPMKRFVYLLAQCRRSLEGKTQKALEDLALADLDARNRETEVEGYKFEDDLR